MWRSPFLKIGLTSAFLQSFGSSPVSILNWKIWLSTCRCYFLCTFFQNYVRDHIRSTCFFRINVFQKFLTPCVSMLMSFIQGYFALSILGNLSVFFSFLNTDLNCWFKIFAWALLSWWRISPLLMPETPMLSVLLDLISSRMVCYFRFLRKCLAPCSQSSSEPDELHVLYFYVA